MELLCTRSQLERCTESVLEIHPLMLLLCGIQPATKSKLKLGEIGVKSNSKTVAFDEVIGIPAAAKVASKVASPVQALLPSFSIVVFGPAAFKAFPVLSTTPLCKGKFGLVFWK